MNEQFYIFFWQQHVMLLLLVFVAIFFRCISSGICLNTQTLKNWSEIYNRTDLLSLFASNRCRHCKCFRSNWSRIQCFLFFIAIKCSNDTRLKNETPFQKSHSNQTFYSHPSTCRLNPITISTTSQKLQTWRVIGLFQKTKQLAPLYNFHNVNFKWLSYAW